MLKKKGITLISLVITIIIILILAGVGISGSLALIEEAKFTADMNKIKQVEEAVQIHLLEKQLEKAKTGEDTPLFKEPITDIDDIPESIRKEIEYVRKLLEGKLEENTLPSSQTGNIEIGEGKKIYYVDGELVEGREEAYIYDEQSARVYKVEPTIVWGVAMHGYEYGNLLVTQPELLKKAKEEAGVETPQQPQEPEEPEEPTVADYMEEAVEKNTYTKDKYGNEIVIPKDFRVVPHGEDYVEYDYDQEEGTATNIPVVQDGIVIEHKDDENQFVWVPVGTIKNGGKENYTETTEIKLGRYDNANSNAGFAMNTSTTPPTPPNPKQLASNWSTATAIGPDGLPYFYEYAKNETYGNTKANNLEAWINSTIANKGYYIARYEASYGEGGTKALSQPSKSYVQGSSAPSTRTTGQLWNWITQPAAATASRNMYSASTNTEYYSDLVNSYAWDTAIIFIQCYSGNVEYAKQTTKNTSLANTGERGVNDTDKVCNIYDMASNVYGWTTETATYSSSNPCGCRGGGLINTSLYSSYRNWDSPSDSHYGIAFRPLLYVSSTET